MRILHVISSLDPVAGGPPLVASRLAAAQTIGGAQVQLVSYLWDGTRARVEQFLSAVPYLAQVQRHFLPPPAGLGDRLRATSIRKPMQDLLSGTDIVHLHGVWDAMLKATADVAYNRDVPYVITSHGMLDPWSLNQSKWKKRIALALGYRRMLDRAAFLHVLNDDEKRLVEPMGLRCPLEVIPNGVFLEELADLPPAGSFYTKFPDLHRQPYVLFLSRLHHKKGLDYLAEAFILLADRIPWLHLVVAGPDDGARQPFEQRIGAAGLKQRVHLVGPLYGPDKFAALIDAACFCLPSRQEGFSIAIIEALACGVPVVISEACHFPQVAESDAGKVVPLDPIAIADAIQQVLADEPARLRMGRAGSNLIRSRFTWPQIAEQSIAAYKKVLSA